MSHFWSSGKSCKRRCLPLFFHRVLVGSYLNHCGFRRHEGLNTQNTSMCTRLSEGTPEQSVRAAASEVRCSKEVGFWQKPVVWAVEVAMGASSAWHFSFCAQHEVEGKFCRNRHYRTPITRSSGRYGRSTQGRTAVYRL